MSGVSVEARKFASGDFALCEDRFTVLAWNRPTPTNRTSRQLNRRASSSASASASREPVKRLQRVAFNFRTLSASAASCCLSQTLTHLFHNKCRKNQAGRPACPLQARG
jgi:hypothetical protein